MALGFHTGSCPLVAGRYGPAHRCPCVDDFRQRTRSSRFALLCGVLHCRQLCCRVAVSLDRCGEPRRRMNGRIESISRYAKPRYVRRCLHRDISTGNSLGMCDSIVICRCPLHLLYSALSAPEPAIHQRSAALDCCEHRRFAVGRTLGNNDRPYSPIEEQKGGDVHRTPRPAAQTCGINAALRYLPAQPAHQARKRACCWCRYIRWLALSWS